MARSASRLVRAAGPAALAWVFAVACGSAEDAAPPHESLPPDLPPVDGAASGDGGVLEASSPDGATAVDTTTCSNGTKDGDESDVDCGGTICPACGDGRACSSADDCTSAVCAGGKCSGDVGCSDGTREGFGSIASYPNIAACAGAWSIAGVQGAGTTSPACGRHAGNDGKTAAGTGCNVADLCQIGWHVCSSPADVAAKSPTGCTGAAGTDEFYATRQSGAGSAMCGAGSNDVFGCGTIGAVPDTITCAPLDRFSGNLCGSLPASWSCGADAYAEAAGVTKTASSGGGVLCCRD